jgi:hypothetical protein
MIYDSDDRTGKQHARTYGMLVVSVKQFGLDLYKSLCSIGHAEWKGFVCTTWNMTSG